MSHSQKIAVIGLGSGGVPMAAAFARPLIGFDNDAERVSELQTGLAWTREVDAPDLKRARRNLTFDKAALESADVFITVPAPFDAANRPISVP